MKYDRFTQDEVSSLMEARNATLASIEQTHLVTDDVKAKLHISSRALGDIGAGIIRDLMFPP